MTSLHRQAAQRRERARIRPGARAAVVRPTPSRHDPGPPAQGQPRVAQYAQSADYHRVLGHRLERLANTIRELVPGSHTRVYVDAGAVPERELAQRAGLGWIAKNMMLIHPAIGSFPFLGVGPPPAPPPPPPPLQGGPRRRRPPLPHP